MRSRVAWPTGLRSRAAMPISVSPDHSSDAGWAAHTLSAIRGSVSEYCATTALRTTATPTRSAAQTATIARPIRADPPPLPCLAVAALRDHQDFSSPLAELAVAVTVAIALIAIADARIGRLGEGHAENVCAGRFDPVDRLDRRTGPGLAAFDHEQHVAGSRSEQRHVGEAERRWGINDDHVGALGRFVE